MSYHRTRSRWILASFASLAVLSALAACGSRTGLELFPDGPGIVTPDATAPGESPDASSPEDAPNAPDDVTAEDTFQPLPDGAPLCVDGGVTSAYLWGESGMLYTFDPTTLETQLLGTVVCPTTEAPFTLSVSRTGFAYMLFEDWKIYRVDLTTLACTATPYQPSQLGLTGSAAIAVSRDPGAERLYVYGMNATGPTLGQTDLTSFVLTDVGPVTPNPNAFPLDMQADAFGHLFALSPQGALLELDPATANVIELQQTTYDSTSSWAIMTWNDQLYFFAGNQVSLYDPSSQLLTLLGTVSDTIVGASAVACIH